MEIKNILLVILPIVTAVLTAWLTYCFTNQSAKRSFKADRYQNLLCFLKGFIGPNVTKEQKEAFFDELYKSRIYCSDEVILAINEFMDFFMKHGADVDNGKKGQALIGKIHMEIRKELLGKTRLKAEDFRYFHIIN